MIKAPPAPVEMLHIQKRAPELVVTMEDAKKQRLEKHTSFYHSGDLGDVIFSLPVIRSLGGGALVLGPNKNYPPFYTREIMNPKRAAQLIPLLRMQEYIKDSWFSSIQPDVTYDLNQFRTLFDKYGPHENLCYLHLRRFGIPLKECTTPWLNVGDPIKVSGKTVVVSRSLRYHGAFEWARVMAAYGDKILFLGLPEEHADFCSQFGYVQYRPTTDLLEAAKVIAGCELFIGNQSALHAIAQALKVRVIQEKYDGCSNVVFDRPGAWYELPDPLPAVTGYTPPPPVASVVSAPLSITFRSAVDGFSGIGQSGTRLMLGLKERGHSVVCLPTRESGGFGGPSPRIAALKTPPDHNAITLVYETVGQLARNLHRGDVAITLWESDRWPKEDVAALNQCRLVLVTCKWNAECLAASGCTVPIKVIPLGIDRKVFYPSDFPSSCTFGASGRVSGSEQRKGVDDVVEAFLAAFRKGEDARLRIKIFHDCPITPKAKDTRIDVARDFMTPVQLAAWHRGNLAFVSASKGEGFGLCLLEAMACGCAPVACNYGGQSEFFDGDVGYEIPYSLAATRHPGHGNWAIPSMDVIAATMQRIYAHQDEAVLFGRMAASRAELFSWERAVECLEKELSNLP